jgi:adenosylcobinamide-GDP ribazoletransferase
MKRILLAFQFLTIIPFKDTGEVPEKEVGSSAAFFPLVGLIEGMILVILAAIFIRAFPTELTNGLLVLAMVIVNGCLHIDGLADAVDALASRGDTEKKLEIMKDSTVGPAGVTAIVMALLLKYLLLNALFFSSTLTAYYSTLLLMPVLSRWIMVPVMFHGKSVRRDGLGKIFIDYTGGRTLLAATFLTLLISFLTFSYVSHYPLLVFHLMFVMPALYIFGFMAVWFCNRNFEGMTGDTIGAVYEVSVLMFLMMRVIWSQELI